MKKKTKKKTGNKEGSLPLLLTAAVWLLMFVIPLLFGDFTNGIKWDHILKIWKEYSVLFLIFLVNRFALMPRLFFKGRRTLYFVSILGIILISSALLYWVQIHPHHPELLPLMDPPGPGPEAFRQPSPLPMPREFIPPYANLFIMSILFIGFDSGILFFSKWMHAEQNKLKAEKESIENKMAFLQNQISPHFFMNTLNNIHALIDIDTEEAKEAVIKLSKMMDYMLYESQTAKISLQKEMDFINSYVDLMKLRFTDDVEIMVNQPKVVPPVKIPPLLTISFIENAFKYGISYESHSFIHIDIETDDKQLSFSVKNSTHPHTAKKRSSGIGIANARNRLDLIYGKDYRLSIRNDEKDHSFNVDLKIPL
ncbi:sensor histidine kinase [Thermophagus sp. OGC60D27]|uniref:sensor histidine kinase n=1 Tax=Thermophagus sp. OGC60D27 TaxID=3458415 RepID=UPI004037D45E